MMQISESYNQKKSLFNAMNRFISAVNNMDQTVMVPSLLRDVPLDNNGELKAPRATPNINGTAGTAYFHGDGDMYGSYVLLKSIRNDMEWGVLQGEERRKEAAAETGAAETGAAETGAAETGALTLGSSVEEDDLEKQFHHHLNGLHAILSKLTLKAVSLTNRYKEEIGCRN